MIYYYSYKSLTEIASVLNELHRKYGYCLRNTSVIYLVYIKNFLMDYAVKCRKVGISDEELRWVSVPLYEGIHQWYKKFDRELIRSMNKPSLKYFAHTGLKYNFLLKVYGLYFNKTEPYKYINDENSILNQMIYNREEIFKQFEDNVIEKIDKIDS